MSGFRTSISCLEYFSTLCSSSKEYTYVPELHGGTFTQNAERFRSSHPLSPSKIPQCVLGRFILNVLMLGQYPRNGMFYYPNFSCHHIRGWPDYLERASWGLVPKKSPKSFFRSIRMTK